MKVDLSLKKTLIFDMDGTIIDMEGLNFAALEKAAQDLLGYPLSLREYTHQLCGAKGDVIARAIYSCANHPKPTSGELMEFISYFRDFKRDKLANQFDSYVELKPGVLEFIEQAYQSQRNIYMGTSASREFAIRAMQTFGLIDYFERIYCAQDVSHGKPAPDVYLNILRNHDIKAEDAVIFEDSPNGVKAAHNSGIDFIIIHTPHINDHVVQEYEVDSIKSYDEVTPLL